MNSRDKCLILAAAASITPLPTRETVQRLKHSGKHFHYMRTVLGELLGGEPSIPHIDATHDHYKKFKKVPDNQFSKKFPELEKLWNDGVANPVASGGNQGATHIIKLSEIKTIPTMLLALNLLLKQKTLSPIKKWTGTKKQLEQRIKKVRESIEKDIPPWKVYPTGVAEGAYRDGRQGVSKTGHTSKGKSKSVEKRERINAKYIAKRIDGDTQQAATGVKRLPEDASVLTLSQIALSVKMDPKTARRKARLYKRDLEKLQIAKYKFDPKDADKVAAIIQRDGRK